jgi:murein DD-endopeptidase MepM/ murein hydrolase activator NlpD
VNPIAIRAILLAITFRNIVKDVLITLLIIILLPLLSVLTISNAGIQVVSNQLATLNLQNHTIEIRDPTGKVIATIQAVWPVRGIVTLEFGAPDPPYQPVHTGIDIAAAYGTPITPFMRGTVSEVGHLNWGYGNYVVVANGNNITSLYGHMEKTQATVGQSVQPGDVIGYEGQTGWATGPHVHFQINVFGIPVNPRTFVEGNP